MARHPRSNFTVEVRRSSKKIQRPNQTPSGSLASSTPDTPEDKIAKSLGVTSKIPPRAPEIARRFNRAPKPDFAALAKAVATEATASEPGEVSADKRWSGRILPNLIAPVETAPTPPEREVARRGRPRGSTGPRVGKARQPRIMTRTKATAPQQGSLDLRQPERLSPDDAQVASRRTTPAPKPPAPIASEEVAKLAERRATPPKVVETSRAPEKVEIPRGILAPERSYLYNGNLQAQARRFYRTMTADQMAGVLKPGERWKRRIPQRLW